MIRKFAGFILRRFPHLFQDHTEALAKLELARLMLVRADGEIVRLTRALESLGEARQAAPQAEAPVSRKSAISEKRRKSRLEIEEAVKEMIGGDAG